MYALTSCTGIYELFHTIMTDQGLETMTIDIEQLREDMKQESYGAFFGGGFGGALIESFDIDNASPEELVRMALRKGIDLEKYEIESY